jgi:hypothetical protein
MNANSTKPKLLFFQNKYDERLPEFLLMHKQEHVRCLSLFFDVTVINEDCDYQEVCGRYQPDLALFESGVNLFTCVRPKISNGRNCDSIPKLGFFNADAWCETRAGSLSEMDELGIDTFFSICVTAREHMPAIADRLYVWPNSIDAEVYRDYHAPKLIPVLLAGATAAQYPWRRRVYKLLAEHYPSLSCPHRGYLSRSPAGQVLQGEGYARTINASSVAPVCGTVAREIVRKHFEIPGCNSCLITERSRHLEQAGFADMVNCIFADEQDVLEKVDFLFAHPDELEKITAAGHDLVHSRHTLQQRNQVWQWYSLHKTLKPNETIVQENPFAPMVVQAIENLETRLQVSTMAPHLRLLHEGNVLLSKDSYEAAEKKYVECLSYMRRLPEARFKIALCKLHQGEAAEANRLIVELLQYSISEYRAADPDPVEWAYYIVSLLCMGKLRNAQVSVREYPLLRHPELDRVRTVVQLLTRKQDVPRVMETSNQRDSIHQLPELNPVAWHGWLLNMLTACGQAAAFEALRGLDPMVMLGGQERPALTDAGGLESQNEASAKARWSRRSLGDAVWNAVPGPFGRQLAINKLRRKVQNLAARATSLYRGITARFSAAPRTAENNECA